MTSASERQPSNGPPVAASFPQCFNLHGNAGRNILIGPGSDVAGLLVVQEQLHQEDFGEVQHPVPRGDIQHSQSRQLRAAIHPDQHRHFRWNWDTVGRSGSSSPGPLQRPARFSSQSKWSSSQGSQKGDRVDSEDQQRRYVARNRVRRGLTRRSWLQRAALISDGRSPSTDRVGRCPRRQPGHQSGDGEAQRVHG